MIGKIIREKRIRLNLTQAKLGEFLGVSGPAVAQWENGTSTPDTTLLAPLARCLDTDVNTLLGFSDRPLSDSERKTELNRMWDTIRYEGEWDTISRLAECLLFDNNSDIPLLIGLGNLVIAYTTYLTPDEAKPYLKLIESHYELGRRTVKNGSRDWDALSHALVNVYTRLGWHKDAENSLEDLSTSYPEYRQAHADYSFAHGNYYAAIPKIRENILRNVIDLFQNIQQLSDSCRERGDLKTEKVARDCNHQLSLLFGLCHDFDTLCRAASASDTAIPKVKTVPRSKAFDIDYSADALTSCSLFDGVNLTGTREEEKTIADRVADLFDEIKRSQQKNT